MILEFTFDDLMRIKSWHFAVRTHRELVPRYGGNGIYRVIADYIMFISFFVSFYIHRIQLLNAAVLLRSVLALQASNQDPSLLDQISKNVTRQGITPATLNYLRVTLHRQLIQIFQH